MKKLLVILMLITCTFAMQGCFIQFPLFVDVPRIDIKDGRLTYDGKEYILLEYYSLTYNFESPITQVGWTHGPYTKKMAVYTFDDDLEKNFIGVEGTTARLGVNKDYNMIPLFECHINEIWVGKTIVTYKPINVIWVGENIMIYKDIEAIRLNQLVDFETSIERTTSFDNSSRGHVRVTLKEYPFLSYRFSSLYLVDEKFIMGVLDSHNIETFYPIQAEYYYLFQK